MHHIPVHKHTTNLHLCTTTSTKVPSCLCITDLYACTPQPFLYVQVLKYHPAYAPQTCTHAHHKPSFMYNYKYYEPSTKQGSLMILGLFSAANANVQIPRAAISLSFSSSDMTSMA